MPLVVLLLGLLVSASANQWSSMRWGLDIHPMESGLRLAPDEIVYLEKAFTVARSGLQWNIVETTKGIYNFTIGEEQLKDVPASKVVPYWILCYGNPLYPDCSPDTNGLHGEECFDAFVRYAVAAIQHFRNRGIIWEMYNEPNGFANVIREKYVRMVNAVGAAVRGNATTKNEILVGPALFGFDYTWISAIGASGALHFFDGISVHPYDTDSPEQTIPKFAKLRNVVQQYLPAGHQQPAFLQGEWGTPTLGGDNWVGGSNLARQWLVSDLEELAVDIAYGIPLPPDSKQPRVCYLAAVALQRLLGRHSFVERVDTQDKDFYLLKYAYTHSANIPHAYAMWYFASTTRILSARKVGSGHQSVCPEPFAEFVSAVQCNESDVQQLRWGLGFPDATGRRQIKFDGDRCLDARDPEHLKATFCQESSASQKFIFHENGTITAPDTPNKEGEVGGCLNVWGRAGPGLYLAKCYSTPPHVDPNQGFIFNTSLGTFEDKGSDDIPNFPKRCIAANIVKDGISDCEGLCIRTPNCRSFSNRSDGSCKMHAHPCLVPSYSPDCGSNCSGVEVFTMEHIASIPVDLESCFATFDMLGNATGRLCPKLGQTVQLSQDPQYWLPENGIVI